MKRFSTVFALAVLGASFSAFAQESNFRFMRELKMPELPQEDLLAIPLDDAIYDATNTSLTDMRVWEESADAIPYLKRKVQAKETRLKRRSWKAGKPALRPLEEGGLEITLNLRADDPPVDGLRVVTPLRDFEQRVRVFASADGTEWRSLGDSSVLFDYSRYMDVRNVEIQIPKTHDRHLRIVVDKVTSEEESQLMLLTRHLRGGKKKVDETQQVVVARRPFRIERIELLGEVTREQQLGDRKQAYEISGFRIEEDREEQQTLIYVETPKTPLTSFRLKTSAKNFSRRLSVSVETTQGKETVWTQLASSVVSRIDFKSLQREQLEINFPETRAAKYRLAIDNRDSPPLSVQGVSSEGNVYQLVFLAKPGGRYQLVYGSESAGAADYDTAAIRAGLGEGFVPAPVGLGEPQAFGVSTKSGSWTDFLKDTRLWFFVIVALVILLALALLSANRRMAQLPAE